MKKKNGFTLIEMLAVVLIIAILSGVAWPQYRKVIEKARIAEVESMLRTIYDSSERLAGEFGYRTYAALVGAKGEANYSFSRMDMFDTDNLPAGCSLSGRALKCKYYLYYPLVSANGVSYVTAQKLKAPYANTLIVFNRDNQQIYCQNAGNSTACEDVFGLDTVTGI